MRIAIILNIILAVFIAAGCSDKQKASDQKTFFDLRGFFEAEANRLQSSGTPVLKTVSQNQQQEQRLTKVADWHTELSLFIESDINKPSWKNSYKVISTADHIVYVAREENLKTRKISIEKQHGKISKIDITNQVKNALYTTEEHLVYQPDSLYIIAKKQSVRLLGVNTYKISGKFKKQI